MDIPIQFNAPLCKGCGFCVKFCPAGALAMGAQRNARGDFLPAATPELCTACATCAICAMMCPEGAITIQGEEAASA
jgi:2-oxoglutarate ferredoxin oxidoreductase subunit delta